MPIKFFQYKGEDIDHAGNIKMAFKHDGTCQSMYNSAVISRSVTF